MYNFEIIAYRPSPGTPLEDYADFPIGMKFSVDELLSILELGHLTPGIILRVGGGKPGIVVGHYFEKQKVELLWPERQRNLYNIGRCSVFYRLSDYMRADQLKKN